MSYYPKGREPVCPRCGVRKILKRGSKHCADCSGAALRERLAGAAAPVSMVGESFAVNGERAEVTRATPERIKTLEDLIRVCEIDTSEWDIERWVANKWESAAKVDERITVTPLYQVKAWLRRKVAVIDARAELAAMKDEAKGRAIVYPVLPRRSQATGNLLEINLPDHHIGKLAWGKETGYDDYDVKIAERIFDEALSVLIGRTACYQYDRIVLVIGNDILHSDSKAGTTTKGTQVTTDSRYPHTFATTRKMLVRAIEQLRELAPVEAVIVPGNHDELSAWHLGDSLECWFHACEGVTVNNAPTQRKYAQWGKCMLMWTHGDKGKLDDYPLLMASEKPEMWGTTVYREAHTGDKHQRRLIELHGVAVRILPTLCATDDWHSAMTFVGNIRAAEAYIWHRDEGLVGTAVYTVPMKREAA